jgi:hypothetical protein
MLPRQRGARGLQVTGPLHHVTLRLEGLAQEVLDRFLIIDD